MYRSLSKHEVYKATSSAIVVTYTFWSDSNSSHKKGPSSLAITMRVDMIYKTLVVAVLQLGRRRVYDVSIREPTPHTGYRYHHYPHGYFAMCSLFLRLHSDCECLCSVLAAATMLAHLQKSATCTIHSISSHNKHVNALCIHNDFHQIPSDSMGLTIAIWRQSNEL